MRIAPGIVSWYFSIKTAFNVFLFRLVRATVPRYSYDQLMGLGWEILISISFTILLVECISLEHILAFI